nr:hypothetical protein CFP56_74812 [Quercus suber]
MGFDPFLVELEAGGHREEVAVLRGTLVEAGGRREEVGFDPFFLVFWLIVGVGFDPFFLVFWLIVGVGFDPFLVELEVGGHCEEVAVLQGFWLRPATIARGGF